MLLLMDQKSYELENETQLALFASSITRMENFMKIMGLYPWSADTSGRQTEKKSKLNRLWIVVSCLSALFSLGAVAGLTLEYLEAIASPKETLRLGLVLLSGLFYIAFGAILMIMHNFTSRHLPFVTQELVSVFGDSVDIQFKMLQRISQVMVSQTVVPIFMLAVMSYLRLSRMYGQHSELFHYPLPAMLIVLVFQIIPVNLATGVFFTFHLLFCYVAFTIGFAFRWNRRRIDSLWQQHIGCGPDGRNENFYDELCKSRRSHARLSEVVRKFDQVFAPGILCLICSQILAVTLFIGILVTGGLQIPDGVFFTNSTGDLIYLVLASTGSGIFLFFGLIAASFMNSEVRESFRGCFFRQNFVQFGAEAD